LASHKVPWLDSIFDHPTTEPVWYLSAGWAGDPARLLPNSRRLFEESEILLDKYDDPQIELGFRYLLFWAGGFERWIWSKDVDWPLRRDCVLAMINVFDRLFRNNCFGEACFMWWDHLRNFGEPEPQMNEAVVRTHEVRLGGFARPTKITMPSPPGLPVSAGASVSKFGFQLLTAQTFPA
jgi:hypothetical protein